MKENKTDNKRANWLALYETKLNKARPETIGKIDWDTAIFLYNQNLTAGDAVAKYIANHPAIFGG
jgi:hypothetical protein